MFAIPQLPALEPLRIKDFSSPSVLSVPWTRTAAPHWALVGFMARLGGQLVLGSGVAGAWGCFFA